MVKRVWDDRSLVRRAKKGEERAFQEIIMRYSDKLCLYLRHLTLAGDECDDILQEVFVKAYRALSRFDARKRFSPWVYRIAHNEAVNYLKKKNRRRLVSWEDIAQSKDELGTAGETETPEEEWIRKESRDGIRLALAALPEKERELVALRYFLEKSYAEIAEILGVPENTVASRLHRAKKKLAERMERRKKPR